MPVMTTPRTRSAIDLGGGLKEHIDGRPVRLVQGLNRELDHDVSAGVPIESQVMARRGEQGLPALEPGNLRRPP